MSAKSIIFALLAVLYISLTPLKTQASQVCSPELFKYVNNTVIDLKVKLAFFKTISKETFESDEFKNSSSAEIPIKGIPIKAFSSWEKFKEIRSQRFEETKFDYSYEDASNYLKSGLDANGLTGYVACLKARAPLAIWTEGGPEGSSIVAKIELLSPFSSDVNNLTITVTGGTIDGKKRLEMLIARGGNNQFTVQRDLNQKLIIIVSAKRADNGAAITSESIIIPKLTIEQPIEGVPPKIAYCIASGNVIGGMQMWGPAGEPCLGFGGNLGTYNKGKTSGVVEICSCRGRGGVTSLASWGPRGSNCFLPNGNWGKHVNDCRTLKKGQWCSCIGRDLVGPGYGVDGVQLWGPKGSDCGGLWSPGYQYHCK